MDDRRTDVRENSILTLLRKAGDNKLNTHNYSSSSGWLYTRLSVFGSALTLFLESMMTFIITQISEFVM